MSKISATRKLILEEFTAQRPWIDRLIPTINLFFEQVYFALVGGITLRDNIKAQVNELKIRNPANPYTVTYQWNKNEVPTEVRVGQIVEDNANPGTIPAYSFQWLYRNGQIELVIGGLDTTKEYKLRVIGQV